LNLNYVTPRGTWYDNTWKSNQKKSGGVKTNIGIHLFDVVCQLFGEPSSMKSLMKTKRKFKGMIYFKNKIKLSFNLSINAEDLPRGMKSYRVLQVNKKKFDLSKSFTNLHEESYRRILANKGFKIDSYTTVFNLVSKI
jgi:UDP-N-acetyl-2-amino-2-deoxyglucuronate dehydrogenase